MKKDQTDHSFSWGSKFIDQHPILANIVIILIIAVLGIYVAYLATALFTKHGMSAKVPAVENMTYSEAISKLHKDGFRVDIRDSVYRDDVKPGYVIEQFPRANSIVKPGRKIFLYINAVHPKEVILDDDNHPNELALRGFSIRTVESRCEELGFKNIRIVKVMGATDRVVRILANGKPVRKMQKIPVNSSIIIEVSDGRLDAMEDSLANMELMRMYREAQYEEDYSRYEDNEGYVNENEDPVTGYQSEESEEENNIYF